MAFDEVRGSDPDRFDDPRYANLVGVSVEFGAQAR